jgi:glycosyltransferase involved in cell wall biosynthesis
MTNEPGLSVVMPSYNRAETIRETLRHLAEQELDPATYEVIVVVDGSTDHTRAVLDEWVARAPFRLRCLYQSNHGPGYAQNRGLEVAQAPIVLVMADDIFMAPQALKVHLAMHRAHPGQEVAVLGRVEQSPALDQSVFLRKWDQMRFSRFAGIEELPYYRFWACNVSVKREFVLRHGGFRDQRGRGGYNAHEDPELGYRLSLAGLRLLYAPDALGFHHHVMNFEQACRKSFSLGVNFGEFQQLVPEPEIPVAYHVLTWRTLRDHLRALFGPRRQYLPVADRNPASLLLRHLARALLFNALTVRGVWEPLVRGAENNQTIARMMNRQLYRGVLFHHFLRGCRDGNRTFDRARRVAGHAETTPG